jgi:AcrR family transcriptional regulator
MCAMPRWELDSRKRLMEAAMELYAERGFEGATVAGIAERAGLTERTFFRHFADKREVLFAGAEVLEEAMVSAAAGAAGSPLDAVGAALEAAGEYLPEDVELSRRRQAVIDASAELRERELIKLASLSAALANALRERGLDAPTAGLTAEVGIAVFKAAFERWLADGGDFTDHARAALGQLGGLSSSTILAPPSGESVA